MSDRRERGYLVIFLLFGLLVVTVAIAVILQIVNMNRAYELAKLNAELAKNGYYASFASYVEDMTVFNWIISAESAAIAIVVPAQFKKKARNNTDEYLQKWIMQFKDDPSIQPQLPSIIMAYLQTNQNN